MGIITKECIRVVCDNCGKIYEEPYTGYSVFIDKENAMELSQDDHWLTEDGKCYCPVCYDIDADDKVTIKENKITCKGCYFLDLKNRICIKPTLGNRYVLCSENSRRCDKYQTEHTPIPIEQVKKGEYIRLIARKSAPVYIRGEYTTLDRPRGKGRYECGAFDDISKARYLKKGTIVYIGFDF